MRPTDQTPVPRRATPDWVTRGRERVRSAPLGGKIVGAIALVLIVAAILDSFLGTALTRALCFLAAAVYSVSAVVRARRSVLASTIVACCGVLAAFAVADGSVGPLLLFYLLPVPVGVAVVAHQDVLSRYYAPSRTIAWALLWSMPAEGLLIRFLPHRPYIGLAVAVLLACLLLGWRLAKAWQEDRGTGQGQVRATAYGAPFTDTARAGRSTTEVSDGRRTAAPVPARGARTAERQQPDISVGDAMAELDSMIGLAPVKEQVRSIAASIEAARRRALAGYQTEKPMRHFVFVGPPGTGKTAVARIIAKIFYAFGLLETPEVTEAHRADLIGEYLGATAIKTNELVDSALGGVLFIDEAYSLVNEGDGQSDRFGQ